MSKEYNVSDWTLNQKKARCYAGFRTFWDVSESYDGGDGWTRTTDLSIMSAAL